MGVPWEFRGGDLFCCGGSAYFSMGLEIFGPGVQIFQNISKYLDRGGGGGGGTTFGGVHFFVTAPSLT